MHRKSKNQLLSIILLTFLMLNCQSNQDKEKISETATSNEIHSTTNEEKEIKDVLDRILIAVGNRDVQELDDLSFDNAIIGWTYLKDGVWLNKKITIEEYLSNIAENENPEPIAETAITYDISVTKGRLATVTLPTIISQYGVARSEEVNHITMMKDNDQWKLLSVAWTVHRIPEEEKAFDLNLFTRNYAQVWGSNRPEFVAMFYDENGSLQINDGEPAVGRNAISNVAQGFMTRFPDMKVSFDSLVEKPNGKEFHWTFTGTDADPNGKGHKVKVSGFESWTMSEENLIKVSKGNFPTEEYNRQLEFGINQ